MKSKKLLAMAILSVLAFLNAAYLTSQYYAWEAADQASRASFSSFCDLNDTLSCTNVLASPYAKVFGVPFPAIALAVYPVLFLIALLGYYGICRKSFQILAVLSAMGMCFNGFFIYREWAFIGSFCALCLLCSGIIVTIHILSWFGIKEKITA